MSETKLEKCILCGQKEEAHPSRTIKLFGQHRSVFYCKQCYEGFMSNQVPPAKEIKTIDDLIQSLKDDARDYFASSNHVISSTFSECMRRAIMLKENMEN